MDTLPESYVNYCDSLSSLHALEHFGLGRYGDPICFDGHIKGLENFYKILKQNGKLYLSVPIGKQIIEFNSQRLFSISYLLNLFSKRFIIDHFSYVDDQGDLHENVLLTDLNIENNFFCQHGCAIFEMTKI